ncbi:long-chain acyl-CoA synthetase [Haloferula luteola]|uniref:Long-chain acyl-CoA synthetase n=1 Tax=Haloferula luteola TaxID=595692 RepID=A0A840V6K5_9BACT|nr:AMP-binding protein [Haloferula luteola]MBB5353655.1 long-chain acyl-CoA synthetase [Haloferula luteola]
MNLIADILARRPADAIAIISGDRQVTYGELRCSAEPIARDLRSASAHLGRNPRVGLHCPNGVDYIIHSIGILLSDACLVPLAEELTAEERDQIIHTTSLDLILEADFSPNLPRNFEIRALDGAPPTFPEDQFQNLNPAFIRFSSGTTGTSKGVVLSHQTLLDRITAANRGLQLGPSDRVLWMLPMAHHFAVSIVLYLHVGAVTILESSPAREDILATAEKHAATVIYGSPFHFALLAADPSTFRWPSLRLPVATAAALPEATAQAFENRFGQPLIQGLGIIEVGLSVLNLDAASTKPQALGKPLPDYLVRLVDDSGNEVPTGTPGEFLVRGPGLLDAYLVPWHPHPTRDGYFASGDLVVRDTEGHLTLVGRKKSVINVAGMKLFPEEVEACLNDHPAVSRSLVSAQDHPHMGQIPVASIIPADPDLPPKPIELQRHCRAHLSAYKVPLRYTFVAELPLTASGKLKRHSSPLLPTPSPSS